MRNLWVRLFIVVLVFAVAASAQKRNITEKDLFDIAWVGDPQVSPDGSKVAFAKVTVNSAKTNYDTLIRVSTSAMPTIVRGVATSEKTLLHCEKQLPK